MLFSQRPDGQPGIDFWVNDSGATEHVTQNRAGLEDYSPAPAGDKVECTGGNFLPIAGYGRLRLLVDQGDGDFKGTMRELMLEHVPHVPNLGKHNPDLHETANASF